LSTDSGYGYNVSYIQTTNLTHPSLDLVTLLSNYTRGANLTVTLTTAAPAAITDPHSEYEANILDSVTSGGFFGCATLVFNNATAAFVRSYCTNAAPATAVQVPVTVSNGGDTISAPVNISWVPPPPVFQMTARASDSEGNEVCIGYDTLANCERNNSAVGGTGVSGPSFLGLGTAGLLLLIVSILVIAVVVAVVVVRRARRPRSPPPSVLPPASRPPGHSG
jgi:hypothetical protein